MPTDTVLAIKLPVIIILMNFVLNSNFATLLSSECSKTYTGNIKFICLDEHGLWWICRGLSGGEGGTTDDGPGWQAEWPRVRQRWPQEGEERCSGQTQSKETHT